jgi:hypothetical protein
MREVDASQDDTGIRENNGRKKRRFETKISAFLKDSGRIAASSFPHTLKKTCHPETHPPLDSLLKHWIFGG